MATYFPNPHDASEPVALRFVESAAAEFRALKALVATLSATVTYAGAWSTLTGSLPAGRTVTHTDTVWFSLTAIADVTLSEPTSINTDWLDLGNVRRSGDTMSGPLLVPAGAAGAEVPQAQEIGALADAQLLTHYKRANILGEVTQLESVPTGALIESGSNDDGEFVRFANGTQICTYSSTITRTCNTATTVTNLNVSADVGPFTFSRAFIAAPLINWTLTEQSFSSMWAMKASDPTATTSGQARAAAASSATTRTAKLQYMAIGRWF